MKKLKKYLPLLAIVSLLLGAGILFHFYPSSAEIERRVDRADEEIAALVDSEAFQNGSLQEREALASGLMSELRKGGCVSDVFYEDGLFSFQYTDGTLGGLMIEDFSQKVGDIPMN